MIKFGILGFALLASLTLNVSMFVGGTIYNLASSAFESATGLRSVASRNKIAATKLRSQVAFERKNSKKLQMKANKAVKELKSKRLAIAKLKNNRKLLLKRINSTSRRITKRSLLSAKRKLSSMAGKIIPATSIVVVVSMTALSLKDLCSNVKDMAALKRAVDPELTLSEDELSVCAMRVPTSAELFAYAKSSPELAWGAAKEFTTSLVNYFDTDILK